MKKIIYIFGAFLILFLASCSNSWELSVEYIANEGGYIDGEAKQSIENPTLPYTFNSVTAVANEGYKFTGWSDGKTESTRIDSLNESTNFTALFEKLPLITVNYSCSEGGIIVGEVSQSKYYTDSEVTFTQVVASANSGYRFVQWSDGKKEPYRTDTLSESTSLTAIFEIDPTVKISYFATEGGSITGEATQIFEGPSEGSAVTAIANEGYRFVGWDDGVAEATRYDYCDKSSSYIAIFIKVHNITFSSNLGGCSVVGSLNQFVDHESKTTAVTAWAGYGFTFLGWSNGEKSETIRVTATESCHIEAIFERTALSLPIISINTINNEEIVSKEEYLSCFISVENTDEKYLLSNEPAEIRGRGNSTWEYDKKPYRIKFKSGVDLFGNGTAKSWTLISNHSDLSLVRNYLAQSVASDFDRLNFTTSTQFAELYLNDEYIGVYLICEQIQVNENRVNITESYEGESGFLIEMDGRADGKYVTLDDKCYVIKSPDTDSALFTDEHSQAILSYLEACTSALSTGDYNAVCELIDVESFAQAYIVYELFKCVDVGYSSFYMYRDIGGKLCCGPVWDFDRSLGIVGHSKGAKAYNTLWAREQNPWFKALFTFEEFDILVGQVLRDAIPVIEDRMELCYSYIYANRDSFERNFDRWEILGTFVWPNDDELTALDTWDLQVEYTEDYLNNSLDYLISVYLY